jgi:hypothetical protein
MKRFLTLFFFAVSLNSASVYAQDAESIRSLVSESMVNHTDGFSLSIAWYLPDEFWAYIINVNPDIAGTEVAEEMYAMVSDYNFIAVAIGQNTGAGISFTSEEKLRGSMFLTGQDGKRYLPIQPDEMEDDVLVMLDIFQPIMAQFLGELGQNLIFFVFEKTNDKEELIFDPISEKDVTLNAVGVEFTWNLPLSSLIPKKRCPEDAELMNGTWNYCPIHGNALEVVTEK